MRPRQQRLHLLAVDVVSRVVEVEEAAVVPPQIVLTARDGQRVDVRPAGLVVGLRSGVASREEGHGRVAGPGDRRARLAGRVRVRRVRPVRVVVRVSALTCEDTEEHPDVVRRPARAGRAAQPHPRDREVVVVGEGRRKAGLQHERRHRGVGLALPLLVGQQRERIGARGIRERRRAVQVAEQRLDVAVRARDTVGRERRAAGERDAVDCRSGAEDAQVLAQVRLVVLRRVDVREVGIARGDQLEVHRRARAAHGRAAGGQVGAEVERRRHARAGELCQQRSRERDVVGDPNPLR